MYQQIGPKLQKLLSGVVTMMILLELLPLPALASALSESQLQAAEKHWKEHGFVVKDAFSENYRSTGPALITDIQTILLYLGYAVDIHGQFGSQSKQAVQQFQRDHGLTPDGIVGNQTWNLLIKTARSKTNSSSVSIHDLHISSSVNSIHLSPGGATTFTVDFKGQGINSAALQVIGDGISARFIKTKWQPYPNICRAEISVSVSAKAKNGTLQFLLKNDAVGEIMQSSIPVYVTSQKALITAANDLKPTLLQMLSEREAIVNLVVSVGRDCFANKLLLSNLGLAAGSVSSGFLTAGWEVISNPDNLLAIATIESANQFAQEAIQNAAKIRELYDQPITEASARKIFEAMRQFAASSAAAQSLMHSILDEFAALSGQSIDTQAAYLSDYFLSGAFDGVFGNLGNVSELAEQAIQLYSNTNDAAAFAATFIQYTEAINAYRDAYHQWDMILNKLL